MKSFSIIISVLILAVTGNSQIAAANEEKSHLSSVGPERELFFLTSCGTYCNPDKNTYQVCYYGIPGISKPQQICWRNTPVRNLMADSLRMLRRIECGACP